MDVKKAADPKPGATTLDTSPQSSPSLKSATPRSSFSLTHPARRLSLDKTKIRLDPTPTIVDGVAEPFAPKPTGP